MVQTIQMLGTFLGKGWNPGDVQLLAEHTRVFGDLAAFGDTPVHFGQLQSLVDGIEALVASLVGTSRLRPLDRCQALAMSARSRQRHLTRHGCSHSDIVQRVRIRRAREWLDGTSTPIVEIAAALGYTDAANFTRAFRRETGLSPRQYRRKP